MEYKQDISRAYLSPSGAMVPVNGVHKLVMVSGDDRIAELITELSPNSTDKQGPPTDVLVTPLATGSKEYIDWVKTQTLKKDASTAFFNMPPPKIKEEIPQDVTDLLEDTKIMEKVDLPKGLIRYASENSIAEGKPHTYSIRAKAYNAYKTNQTC